MSSLVSLIAVAAVLLHSLLGCCAHHEHGSHGQREAGQSEAAFETAAWHTCPLHLQTLDPPHQPSHDGSRECQEDECSFLPCLPAEVDLRSVMLAHWVPLDLRAAGTASGPFTTVDGQATADKPPQRHRWQARLSVWLI